MIQLLWVSAKKDAEKTVTQCMLKRDHFEGEINVNNAEFFIQE